MISRRALYLLAAVVIFIAAGALVVFAQATDEPTTTPFMHGHHMMGMGHRMMWGSAANPGFTAIAEALDLAEATLTRELKSGKTIAEIAEEQSVDLTTVSEAMQATMEEHLNTLVADGVIMQEHWDEMPMFTGEGCGMMDGAWHGGMWGNHRSQA